MLSLETGMMCDVWAPLNFKKNGESAVNWRLFFRDTNIRTCKIKYKYKENRDYCEKKNVFLQI